MHFFLILNYRLMGRLCYRVTFH